MVTSSRITPAILTLLGLPSLAFIGCATVPTRPSELLPYVEVEINRTPATIDDYVTWAPMPARIRISNTTQGNAINVVLRNMDSSRGGQILFAQMQTPWPPNTTAVQSILTLTLPTNGDWVDFVIAGQFGRHSIQDKDAIIEVREDRLDGIVLARKALMVRVRKNANTLTADERDRFLNAVVTLNQQMSNYEAFQLIHATAFGQAHGGSGFLPWHRAFVLRLERELQGIDPSVSLHYWRFDQPAASVFHEDFMGISDQAPPNQNYARFSFGNPLRVWIIQGLPGIPRRPNFLPGQSPAGISSEITTLALGSGYVNFKSMEGNPHGTAHGVASGGGWIGGLSTAVRDPLFFFLHSNVDRLWGKWQYAYGRFDSTFVTTYDLQGAHPGGGCQGLGHYLQDTMWPWNGSVSPSDPCRPSTAPGGSFPQTTPGLFTPPTQPRPVDMIEYRTHSLNMAGQAFAYDDIPFN